MKSYIEFYFFSFNSYHIVRITTVTISIVLITSASVVIQSRWMRVLSIDHWGHIIWLGLLWSHLERLQIRLLLRLEKTLVIGQHTMLGFCHVLVRLIRICVDCILIYNYMILFISFKKRKTRLINKVVLDFLTLINPIEFL